MAPSSPLQGRRCASAFMMSAFSKRLLVDPRAKKVRLLVTAVVSKQRTFSPFSIRPTCVRNGLTRKQTISNGFKLRAAKVKSWQVASSSIKPFF